MTAIENRELVAQITAAYLSNPNHKIDPAQIGAVLKGVHDGLANLDGSAAEHAPKPAVPVKKSITNEHIVCLEDGKKLKMLKRYLRTNYNLTPDDYRRRWGLPADYPMVAPNYAVQRSEFAKKIGLGKNAPHNRRRAGQR